MTRLNSVLGILATVLLAAGPLWGQQDDLKRREFLAAGVCSNCHITSTLEWGISKHSLLNAGDSLPNCVGCHGTSQRHVADEQKLVKPDRIPRGAAITTLCMECHSDGCSATAAKEDCRSCHDHHASANPSASAEPMAKRGPPLSARSEAYRLRLDEGEKLLKDQKFPAAREAFNAALKENPDSERAKTAIKIIDQRISQGTPGPTTTPATKP